jgi:hypothetical protein
VVLQLDAALDLAVDEKVLTAGELSFHDDRFPNVGNVIAIQLAWAIVLGHGCSSTLAVLPRTTNH